jgi:hypothetical protein
MDETSFDPSGAKGANRTRDTALFRRVLYRLSYSAKKRQRRPSGGHGWD